MLQSQIKQQVKGEQRASAWEVINMCGRLEKISNTNVNRKSEAWGGGGGGESYDKVVK